MVQNSTPLVIATFICLIVAAALSHTHTAAAPGRIETMRDESNVYIVYMGASNSNIDLHTELVSSLSGRVMHKYMHGFLGFAARLTDEEAKSFSDRPDVVSVFPDRHYALHTTRSWEFLEQESTRVLPTNTTIVGVDSPTGYGSDTIIGILDSGIWPESESFNDEGMPPIPSRWNGVCMEGLNFAASSCNKKLIGARFYDDLSPRDTYGHGTHVASTAAGRLVSGASYYGLAGGTAKGWSPDARIAMYRVCQVDHNCVGSYILKAFDDAIADGVDVISVSIGTPTTDLFTEPIAIGSFHATERGIIVVCSAGNGGPRPGSVLNVAPWIFTVAATTIDRDFETDLVLGGNEIVKGGGINFSNLQKDPIYPLIDGGSAKSGLNLTTESAARSCAPGSLDASKLKGRIIVCEISDGEAIDKFDELRNQYGVTGMIVISSLNFISSQAPTTFLTRPIVVIGKDDRTRILRYITSNSNPTATILPTFVVSNYEPAPVVTYFSSRGPAPNILKPDIAAPGLNILAAWPGFISDQSIPGTESPRFAFLSGTSMACPHVSGLAAMVKSQHPTWSPSAVKSAIMTTALNTNNLGSQTTALSSARATPYDIGSGEISLTGPRQPGLVYEIDVPDYASFLCSVGYQLEMIKLLAPGVVGDNFTCPGTFDLNYPSIYVSKLRKGEVKKVSRVVSNVGEQVSTYKVFVESPVGLKVRVVPDRLHFTKGVQKLEFNVIFKMKKRARGAMFGSISWINAEIKVRSPFVVTGSASRGSLISFLFLLCHLFL